MLRYLLLAGEQTAVDEGPFLPLGRLVRWEAEVEVSYLSAGGSVQVVLETSPTGSEDEASELHDFGSISSVSAVEATTDAGDFTVEKYYGYVRARVAAITGTAVLRVTFDGPILDTDNPNENNMLSAALRKYSNKKRLVDEAAELVVANLQDAGYLDVDLAQEGAVRSLRREIASQADYMFRNVVLTKSAKASNAESVNRALADADEMYPNFGSFVRPYRPQGSAGLVIWRGR